MGSASVATVNIHRDEIRLLVSQRNHRIHLHRTQSRDVARQESHTCEYNRNSAERSRIGCADPEEKTRHQTSESERARNPDDKADRDEPQSLPQSHPKDIAFLCAERQPNPDLARALNDGVTHHAIDTDRGQHERERGEEARAIAC